MKGEKNELGNPENYKSIHNILRIFKDKNANKLSFSIEKVGLNKTFLKFRSKHLEFKYLKKIKFNKKHEPMIEGSQSNYLQTGIINQSVFNSKSADYTKA
jgi:hypothetical protein